MVTAEDADIGSNGMVHFLLFGTEYFNIDPMTGEVTISAAGLDFEVVDEIENPLLLTIIVQDAGKFITIMI